jgi:tetratricopeptide (TPR) repeat protein
MNTAIWINTIAIALLIVIFLFSTIERFRVLRKPHPHQIQREFAQEAYELMDLHKSDELIDMAKARLEEYPNFGYALFSLAVGYYQKGMYVESRAVWEKLIDVNPGYADPYAKPYLEAITKKLSA